MISWLLVITVLNRRISKVLKIALRLYEVTYVVLNEIKIVYLWITVYISNYLTFAMISFVCLSVSP